MGTPKKSNRKAKGSILFRGGNAAAYACEAHQSMLSGPSQTGKTVALCVKTHMIAWNNSKAQCLIVRKVQADMRDTVLRTWAGMLKGYPVRVHGGENAGLYIYPNGSRVVAVGMDKPGKVLSGEYAAIYVNQAEQLTEADWEILASRCTGRGTAFKTPQVFGDCNPSGRQHWIRLRKGLEFFESTHKDNPELYDDAGNITEEGKKQMERLEASLTGVRRERLLLGKWVTSEGAVYSNFDARFHVCIRSDAEMKLWYLGADWGFTNPAVVLLIGEDSDGCWHVFKEFYQRGQAMEDVIKQARTWSQDYKCELAGVDGARPEYVEQFVASGINAKAAKGHLEETIAFVRDMLNPVKGDKSVQWPDGRPRLTVDPSCVETINEFESYVLKPGTDVPVKKDDHAMDALRYAKIAVMEGTGAITSAKDISVGTSATGAGPRVFVPRQYVPTRRL